ncbi:nuclear transport factor 2 family protein [Rhodopila sp.]|uniref:nuclear transport factor 2 family protein n=1 Tax=Rhodopila sp. TaxID=2480087 RepID=UPI003D10FAED
MASVISRPHPALPMMEIKMSETDAVESFPAMLRRVLGNCLKPDAETFPDMFAVDGVLEYPFAPPGLSTPIAGRDAIIANFERIRTLFRIDGVADVSEIEVSDPDMVVLEFSGHGEGLLTKEAYNQRYISVIRMRDGNIVHYKDYWNPIALVQAVKGSEITRASAID